MRPVLEVRSEECHQERRTHVDRRSKSHHCAHERPAALSRRHALTLLSHPRASDFRPDGVALTRDAQLCGKVDEDDRSNHRIFLSGCGTVDVPQTRHKSIEQGGEDGAHETQRHTTDAIVAEYRDDACDETGQSDDDVVREGLGTETDRGVERGAIRVDKLLARDFVEEEVESGDLRAKLHESLSWQLDAPATHHAPAPICPLSQFNPS